jgi:hypothetical protein
MHIDKCMLIKGTDRVVSEGRRNKMVDIHSQQKQTVANISNISKFESRDYEGESGQRRESVRTGESKQSKTEHASSVSNRQGMSEKKHEEGKVLLSKGGYADTQHKHA